MPESTSIYLSLQDIERLTGKKRHSAQIRWLRENGWPHTVNGLGQPLVIVAIAEERGGRPHKRRKEPKWERMYGAATQDRQTPAKPII